ELRGGLAARVDLGPDGPVAPDLEVEALGESVDDRDADAVQASGDLVAPAVAELAAGVEGGENYLRGRLVLRLLHLVDGDAAAVALLCPLGLAAAVLREEPFLLAPPRWEVFATQLPFSSGDASTFVTRL